MLEVYVKLYDLLAHVVWTEYSRSSVHITGRALIASVLIVTCLALLFGIEHFLISALELLVPIYVYSVLEHISEYCDVCTIRLLIREEVAT